MAAAGDRHEDPQTRAALTVIQQRLGEAQSRLQQAPAGQALEPPEIVLLDSPTVNAQALPGGLILIHRGLLERMGCAEELAAVVAHEMAHVRYRDSLSALRRQLGLSLLLSIVGLPQGGEAVERIIEQASSLHYSRRVEARADRYALDLLAAARLDPARLADALERIAGEPRQRLPEVLQYLDTHPALQQRVTAARARSGELQVDEVTLGVSGFGSWPAAPDPVRPATPAGPPDT